jgi:hypothetical protein
MAEQTPEDRRTGRRAVTEARQREAEAAARRSVQQARLKKGAVAGLIALALLLFVGYVVKETVAPLPGETVAEEARTHVDPNERVTYKSYPATSGPHHPSPIAWQPYDQPQAAEDYVHNLEHGGVVVLYNCTGDACTDLTKSLRGLYNSLGRSKYGNVKLVVTPAPEIDPGIWLLAWGHRVRLEKFDSSEISRFYTAYVDHGPEDAP